MRCLWCLTARRTSLGDQWGDPGKFLDSRLKGLRGLGILPHSKHGYQKQIQWHFTLDGMLQDVLDLGDRNDDLADAAFKQSTNRDIINLFPEKVTLKLSKLPGKRREKIKDQLNN